VNDNQDKVNHLVEETKEYYRKRAPQYWDWSSPTAVYEEGPQPDRSFFDEARMLLDALDDAKLEGNVLEIACGPGILTEALVKHAASVTALDSSREMIERSRLRLKGNPKVKFVLADFYNWKPDAVYDAVAFSFWISHVPSTKLDEFVLKVSRCLSPEGRVFFLDQRPEAAINEDRVEPRGEVVYRDLGDKGKFKVFKHFYSPEEIEESFLSHRIMTRITNTPTHFFYVDGQRTREATSSHGR